MIEKKIRVDRVLSIIVLIILFFTLLMFGIRVFSGKKYKTIPTTTYIVKQTNSLEAEKVYISSLLSKKVDLSHVSDAVKKQYEERKKVLIDSSHQEKNLEKLQSARQDFELTLYDIEKLKEAIETPGLTVSDGVHKINDQVIVNKYYALPATYDPKESPEAKNAFLKLILAMQSEKLPVNNSYNGYYDFKAQEILYAEQYKDLFLKEADQLIARAGHSEHQTGLSYEVLNRSGKTLGSNEEDKASIEWLEKNAATYGFIIRYPDGKQAVTGFNYQPGLLRFVGTTDAKKIAEAATTFEEFYKIKGGNYRE